MSFNVPSGALLITRNDGFVNQSMLGYVQLDALCIVDTVVTKTIPQGLLHEAFSMASCVSRVNRFFAL
jgi:hypothetical protein